MFLLIKNARKAAKNPKMVQHLEALYLHAKGLSNKEIQGKTGLSSGMVCHIIYRYGLKGIVDNRYFASLEKYKFTPKQLAEIEHAV